MLSDLAGDNGVDLGMHGNVHIRRIVTSSVQPCRMRFTWTSACTEGGANSAERKPLLVLLLPLLLLV